MKVLIVNTSESCGGAAVAASRLCDALNNNGVKAMMLVRDKQSNDLQVATCGNALQNKLNFYYERMVIWLANRLDRTNLFKVSIANTGVDITKTREFQEADIVHLHWVNQGMLSLKGIGKILRSGKPVVWTMHDMWPLTAICHHALGCDRYQVTCGQCPFLRRPADNDLSARVFRKKQGILHSAPHLLPSAITFVAVSEWLADKARQSALTAPFPTHVIPNALPIEDFTLTDRTDARTATEVKEPYVITFGAARIDDPIKGFNYLAEALRILVASGCYRREDLRLLLFGNVRDVSVFDSLPVPYTYLGYIDDSYRMSQVYSASNVTVSSSLYETFGQTLSEAMACGSVPVSFGGSGQADIVNHQKNGFLAERLSAESLAEGIAWGLKTSEEGGATLRRDLRRSTIRRFAAGVVARQYSDLYNRILEKREQ